MENRLEAILVEMQKLSEESRRLRAQNDRLQYAELKREFDRLIRKKPATNQSYTLQGRDEEDPWTLSCYQVWLARLFTAYSKHSSLRLKQ